MPLAQDYLVAYKGNTQITEIFNKGVKGWPANKPAAPVPKPTHKLVKTEGAQEIPLCSVCNNYVALVYEAKGEPGGWFTVGWYGGDSGPEYGENYDFDASDLRMVFDYMWDISSYRIQDFTINNSGGWGTLKPFSENDYRHMFRMVTDSYWEDNQFKMKAQMVFCNYWIPNEGRKKLSFDYNRSWNLRLQHDYSPSDSHNPYPFMGQLRISSATEFYFCEFWKKDSLITIDGHPAMPCYEEDIDLKVFCTAQGLYDEVSGTYLYSASQLNSMGWQLVKASNISIPHNFYAPPYGDQY